MTASKTPQNAANARDTTSMPSTDHAAAVLQLPIKHFARNAPLISSVVPSACLVKIWAEKAIAFNVEGSFTGKESALPARRQSALNSAKGVSTTATKKINASDARLSLT